MKQASKPARPGQQARRTARPASDARRQAVLEAALACFAEAGVEAVSVAEICQRSGASVGSVYHHFGSKEGIVLALLADGLGAHLSNLKRALADAGGQPKDCVDAVIGSLIAWVEANPRWASFIYANLNRQGAASASAVLDVNRRYKQSVASSFGPLIEAGQVRALPDECWSSLVLAPVHDYVRRWLRDEVRKPPSTRRELFVDAAWRLLRPER